MTESGRNGEGEQPFMNLHFVAMEEESVKHMRTLPVVSVHIGAVERTHSDGMPFHSKDLKIAFKSTVLKAPAEYKNQACGRCVCAPVVSAV